VSFELASLVTVKTASECFRSSDYPPDLFQVRVVKQATNYGFILSINHSIADGYTYYEIYKMLDPSHDIFALEPNRACYNMIAKFSEKLGGNHIIQPFSTSQYIESFEI
jgi:hypothetical protein